MGKILLAFGTHGLGNERPDRAFFSRAVVPFLEEAVAEGRRAVVIHELSLYDRFEVPAETRSRLLYGGSADEPQLREALSAAQMDANLALRKSLDRGLEGGPIEDWGHLDGIRKLNCIRPGSVLGVVEPQSLESLLSYWRISELGDGISPSGVGGMMAFIRTMAEDCVRRDNGVLRLIQKTAAIDPDAAIAVPRGSGHRGMACLLDGLPHSVMIREKVKYEDYLDRAVRLSYARELDAEELRAFATLELRLLGFVHGRLGTAVSKAAAYIGAGGLLKDMFMRQGIRKLDEDIAGGRFELPVPGL